jgi:hypothetical protein
VPDEATLPLWFIIVRRDRPVLYRHLHVNYEGGGRVEVILDRRRAAASEIPAGAEWQRGERRVRDRRAGVAGDRRQPLAFAQQTFWSGEGFFMVRRVADPSA